MMETKVKREWKKLQEKESSVKWNKKKNQRKKEDKTKWKEEKLEHEH